MKPAEDDRDKGSVREIRVTDRRMFTPDGELRSPESFEQHADEHSPPLQGAEREESAPRMASAPRASPGDLPSPGFADLVSFLAEPIALFLGDVELPEGDSAENLELARFHIDLLGVLQEKTKNSVSKDEAAVLDDLLYGLRMRYVQKRK
ncbi:MAG: DUF1844 domain-containing protein [Acidobacteriota bacterium]|nr:DUF1844 domain-containing protein [Acidobacteriota bacterium]